MRGLFKRSAGLVASACLLACFGTYESLEGGSEAGSGDASDASTSAPGTTGVRSGSASSGADRGSSDDGNDDETRGAEDSSTGAGTGGGPGADCDPLDPTTCGAGLKCNPTDFPNGTPRCVAVAADASAAYETCSVFDNPTGADDCAAGSFCYGIDKGRDGTCRPFCGFNGELFCSNRPPYNAPGRCFTIQGSGLLWGWCYPWCDPLEGNACAAGSEFCANDGFGGQTEAFFCETVPADGGAGAGDACVGGYQCGPNLLCEAGECRQTCDLDAGVDTCPIVTGDVQSACGAVTLANTFTDPPGSAAFANVGVCSRP